jgi:hypothetical protein
MMAEDAVTPDRVLDTAASGAMASVVGFPMGINVTVSAPVPAVAGVLTPVGSSQLYVPEYVPGLQSAS